MQNSRAINSNVIRLIKLKQTLDKFVFCDDKMTSWTQKHLLKEIDDIEIELEALYIEETKK